MATPQQPPQPQPSESKAVKGVHNRTLILDCSNTPSFHWTTHQDLQGATQIYLTGYYVENASAARLKIRLNTHSFQLEGPIVNANLAGDGIYLISPVSATAVRKELTTIEPLLAEGTHLGSNLKFGVQVTGWDNSAVTFTNLVLFFLVQYPETKETSRFTGVMGKNYDGTF